MGSDVALCWLRGGTQFPRANSRARPRAQPEVRHFARARDGPHQAHGEHGFNNRIIDTTCAFTEATLKGLKAAVKQVCAEVEKAVDEDIDVLILSDKAANIDRVAIPTLMITGAVHHHLNRVKTHARFPSW